MNDDSRLDSIDQHNAYDELYHKIHTQEKQIELLSKIARESQFLWDKGLLPLEASTLKNLLIDWIDTQSTSPMHVYDRKKGE